MTNERSNIQLMSNVYPVDVRQGRIDFARNEAFVSQVADQEALKRIIQRRYGRVNDYRILEKYASTMPGFQDWQLRRVVGCDACTLAPRGEKPWGFRVTDGRYEEVCRCDQTECQHYGECRPKTERTDAD